MLQELPSDKQTENILDSAANELLGFKSEDETRRRLLTSIDDGKIETSFKSFDEKPSSSHSERFPLCSFDECPAYLAHNRFITDGYRVNYSFKKCILSMFRRHNETYNIWTHFLAFGLFFALMVITPGLMKNAKSDDIIIFLIFCIGAQIQMLASALFHIFHCYSEKVYAYLARMDYCGISIMIVASYYPPFYYAFSCHPTLRIVYLFLISLFGVVGVCVSSLSVFQSPRFRIFRTTFFIVFGLFAVVPMPHLVILRGFGVMGGLLWREALMGATYIGGAFVYMSLVPERFWPGKFNYSACSSHVLWHYFTTVAALGQYYTCIYLYNNKELFQTCT